MKLFTTDGAWYCHLLHRAPTHASTWCQMARSWMDSAHLRRDRSQMKLALKNCSVQRMANSVSIMVLSALLPYIYFPFSRLCSYPTALLCCISVCDSYVSLLVAHAIGTEPPFLQFQACLSFFCGIHMILFLFPTGVSCAPSPSLCSLNMVRHRKHSRIGGSRGGRGRSQRAQSIDQNPAPSSLPVSQSKEPPLNPPCRPFSHSAFQSSRFRFQSNLNRPIISAHISVILSEEEVPPLITIHPLAELSQYHLGKGKSQEDMQNMAAADKLNERGKQHDKVESPNDSQQPGGSSHGNLASLATAGCSSDTRPSSNPPRGNDVGDVATTEEDWNGNTCLVVEEPPELGMEM